MITLEKIKHGDSFESLLSQNPSIYAVDSIEDRKIRYAIAQKECAVLRGKFGLRCKLDEVTTLADWFPDNIKQEILDIYEDIQFLRKAEVVI